MLIHVRRLTPLAKLPTKAHPDDAGFDLATVERATIPPGAVATLPTGIAMELPPGHYAQIVGRSGLGKRGIAVLAGCLDPGYRGEVKVVLANLGPEPVEFRAGDRVAQFVVLPVPPVTIAEVDELSPSDRGAGGFGESGR